MAIGEAHVMRPSAKTPAEFTAHESRHGVLLAAAENPTTAQQRRWRWNMNHYFGGRILVLTSLAPLAFLYGGPWLGALLDARALVGNITLGVCATSIAVFGIYRLQPVEWDTHRYSRRTRRVIRRAVLQGPRRTPWQVVVDVAHSLAPIESVILLGIGVALSSSLAHRLLPSPSSRTNYPLDVESNVAANVQSSGSGRTVHLDAITVTDRRQQGVTIDVGEYASATGRLRASTSVRVLPRQQRTIKLAAGVKCIRTSVMTRKAKKPITVGGHLCV